MSHKAAIYEYVPNDLLHCLMETVHVRCENISCLQKTVYYCISPHTVLITSLLNKQLNLVRAFLHIKVNTDNILRCLSYTDVVEVIFSMPFQCTYMFLH